MYRHIRDYELRYTDVDAYDNLKLSSLLSFLEESACGSADELGFGYSALAPKGLGFIVLNYYIKLERNIKLGEKVTIHTWPLKPRLMVFLRDYEIFVGSEKVGVATSRWFMVDMKTFSPARTSVFFKEGDFDNYNSSRSIEFSEWKIPEVKDGADVFSKKVKYSDYDHYFHMNNTKYVDDLMDGFTVDELKNKKVSSIQINFVKQCKEDEEICYIRAFYDRGYLVEGRVNGEIRVQMRISFDEF